ncbi:MAG TPA: prephenate dehydratase domain-containing protein [Polyangiaceae bacterium]|jgi:chorismate mutase/prephenate dehydratase|nr:prephenate dehydratase domain-containing protein [Polyangiaceae bacterium]
MDAKREVTELRSQIAKLDEDIVQRLDARAKLSREIHNLIETDPSADVNEKEWLDHLIALSGGELPSENLRGILQQIRAAARGIEQPARVSYLGPEGSFCNHMALGYFGTGASFIECASVEEVLEEVVRGRAAYAAFPFESSIDGLVQSSVTALSHTDLMIVAERSLSAPQNLMSRAAQLSDVEKVYATAATRASCSRFLDKELPRASVIDVRSPVVAASLAAEEPRAAAIVPEPSGSAAGLSLLRENVGDLPDLKLRYCVASQRPASRSGNDVTCLLFSVDDSAGALFDVLKHFAERSINVKKLHSRPVARETWNYVFYVEISGHVTERQVVTALEAVKRSTKYLKVLGSFPLVSS